jgi:hypothetical protein
LGPQGVPESIPGLQQRPGKFPPGRKEEIMIIILIIVSAVILAVVGITVSVTIRVRRK